MKYLSQEQQKQLLTDWKKNGNKASLDTLIMSNQRLVMKEALKLKSGNKNIDLEDLVQEGNLGLSIAADKFDLTKDNVFVTYAVFWIRQRIKSYILNNRSVVRLGTTSDSRKIFSALPKIMRELDEEDLTLQEKINIASKQLKVKKKSIYEMMNILKGYDSSLSQPVSSSEDNSRTLSDILTEDEDVEGDFEERDMMKKFKLALLSIMKNDLSEHESYVVKRRFLLDERKTYDEIAKEIGLSRQYVRSREEDALKKIKAKLRVRFGLKRDCFFEVR
jgi:RNA polymerase sigma-32 factor